MALRDSRMTKKTEEDRTILIELDARGRHHTTRASDHCHPPAVRFFVIFQITHTIYFLERKNIESADRELTRKHWLRRKNFQIKVKFLQRIFFWKMRGFLMKNYSFSKIYRIMRFDFCQIRIAWVIYKRRCSFPKLICNFHGKYREWIRFKLDFSMISGRLGGWSPIEKNSRNYSTSTPKIVYIIFVYSAGAHWIMLSGQTGFQMDTEQMLLSANQIEAGWKSANHLKTHCSTFLHGVVKQV